MASQLFEPYKENLNGSNNWPVRYQYLNNPYFQMIYVKFTVNSGKMATSIPVKLYIGNGIKS